MTFKVSSSQTNDNFMICETVPPEANVEPHSHPEAETFYILKVNLLFLVEGVNEPKICKIGAFVSPPTCNTVLK